MSDDLTPADSPLDQATGPRPPKKPAPPPLHIRKQLDQELDDELEAALADFDQLSEGELGLSAARRKPPEEQDAVRHGRVVAVRGDDLFVDLGGKSEGLLPARTFTEKGEPVPDMGATVEVIVDRYDHDQGVLLLTRKGAAVDANWENLREGLVVEARVTGKNKGGLEVEVGGIRGFIPASQIDVVHVEELSDYVNQRFPCVVTEANRQKRNLVLSRRALIERELAERRENTWQEIEEGQVRTGTVKSIKPFGAFVEIDGVDGLLHVSQMSWARVEDPAEIVQPGQQIRVQVIKVDRDARKVGLGLKQLAPSPWDNVEQKYLPTSLVTGKVTRVADFGAFVELEPGVEGLIHISEVSPQRVHRVRDFLEEGQEVSVVVLSIDHERKRIALSLKAAQAAEEETGEAQDEPQELEEAAPETPPPTPRKTPLKGGLERIE